MLILIKIIQEEINLDMIMNNVIILYIYYFIRIYK